MLYKHQLSVILMMTTKLEAPADGTALSIDSNHVTVKYVTSKAVTS